jgi:sigma-B regulation protein RsbU (phosphoserine phosphatase)
MLPHSFPHIPGFVLAARNEPARQVGGDFYDVIVLDEDHFGIVVADVADKGLPAALYMALTRSLLLAEARRTCSPRETLININRLLLELGELNGFVSVFYAVVQCSSHRMTYTRAGHERPLLLRDGQVSALDGEGPVLGVLQGEDFQLSEEQTDLAPGDLLFLYTDGLTDVLDASGHFSGIDPLKHLLQNQAGKDANAVCEAVFKDLIAYRGTAEQFDDMTLLVLNVTELIQTPVSKSVEP